MNDDDEDEDDDSGADYDGGLTTLDRDDPCYGVETVEEVTCGHDLPACDGLYGVPGKFLMIKIYRMRTKIEFLQKNFASWNRNLAIVGIHRRDGTLTATRMTVRFYSLRDAVGTIITSCPVKIVWTPAVKVLIIFV